MADKPEEADQRKGPGGTGVEKEEAEVAGRARRLLWVCWNDGAGNYVDPTWKWFSCWKCGAVMYSDGKGGYTSDY